MNSFKLAIIITMLSFRALAQSIDAPYQDYFQRYGLWDDQQVMALHVDISGDGKDDILLTRSDFTNARAMIWTVYMSSDSAFSLIEKSYSFDEDAYHIGPFPGLEGNVLFHYHPNGAERGVITGMQIRDSGVETVARQEVQRDRRMSDSRFEGLFDQPNVSAIQKMTFEEFKQIALAPTDAGAVDNEVEAEPVEEVALTQTASVQEPADIQPEIVDTTTEIVQQPESGTSEPLAPPRNYVPYIVVGLILLAGVATFGFRVASRK